MEEKKINIVAIQMSSKLEDKQVNFKKVIELLSKKAFEKIDIVVLPETWNINWKPTVFEKYSEDPEGGETIDFLADLAKKYNAHVIGGSLPLKDSEGQIYNSCPVFNPKGELIETYYKMHLFSHYGCDEGKYAHKGHTPKLIEINGVKIGLSICYDIRFPELFRAYSKAGVDLLINMAAWPKARPTDWDILTKSRSIENQCFMLAVNQCGLVENGQYTLGHSRLINYDGTIISELGEAPEILYAQINFEKMYQFRDNVKILLDIQDTYEVR